MSNMYMFETFDKSYAETLHQTHLLSFFYACLVNTTTGALASADKQPPGP
jgi:hypothetical protein